MKAGSAAMTYSTGGSSSSSGTSSSGAGGVLGSPSVVAGGGGGGGALDEDLSNSVASDTSEPLPRASFNSALESE